MQYRTWIWWRRDCTKGDMKVPGEDLSKVRKPLLWIAGHQHGSTLHGTPAMHVGCKPKCCGWWRMDSHPNINHAEAPECQAWRLYSAIERRAPDIKDAEAAGAELGLVEALGDARLRGQVHIAATGGQPEAVAGRPPHVLHPPSPAQHKVNGIRPEYHYLIYAYTTYSR